MRDLATPDLVPDHLYFVPSPQSTRKRLPFIVTTWLVGCRSKAGTAEYLQNGHREHPQNYGSGRDKACLVSTHALSQRMPCLYPRIAKSVFNLTEITAPKRFRIE